MKHVTSCVAEEFSWERITRRWVFRPNVKEFIIWEQVKSPLRVAKLTYIYIKMSRFITKPSKYYGAWEERNQSLISSPLPSSSSSIHSISHSLYLLVSVSHPLSLHYFIVSQCRFHCLAFLRAVPPPGLRNTPSTCLPGSYMSSCFPNPVQQTRQLGARLDLYLC